MSPTQSAATAPVKAPVKAKPTPLLEKSRSPLSQLLHALNQPLTGLQCSLEVTLARPRTHEQYLRVLREGIELTSRVRALVETIREVADLAEEEEEKTDGSETTELRSVLNETVAELRPVAESRKVEITMHSANGSPLTVRAARGRLARFVFRLLDSVLGLAPGGTVLPLEAGSAPNQVWVRICWDSGLSPSKCSRAEMGLLVVQAGLEKIGAQWERGRTDDLETLTVRLPSV
jgi:hypothetical protein